ncbi:MAG: homoserine kinase [Acidobacteria bacterium]|nr:homoserine kinase [Acidobacteriota bacterium]
MVFPATSANLGPGFDAAALAMSLALKVQAVAAEKYSIRAFGRDQSICGALESNLILETYRDEVGEREVPLALTISNQIPIGKGCGSSAAARLAGVALAAHFGQKRWSSEEILERAAAREGHPDNAAACWLGGVVLTQYCGSRLFVTRLPGKVRWQLLLAVPEQACSTEEARRILPEQYTRADAVQNIRSAMLLTASLISGRADILQHVNDRVHEPYRSSLCPLLPAFRPLAGTAGIAGVALSGAGPSVLMFLDDNASRDRAQRAVNQRLRESGLAAELIFTSVEGRGAGRDFAGQPAAKKWRRQAAGSKR